MGDPAQRVPSFAELYRAIQALPSGVTGMLLEPGVIHTMSRPGGPHRFTQRRVLRALGAADAAEGGSGWWLEQEAEIRFLGDRLAVPDLAGWRVPPGSPPDFVDDNLILVIPEFACEVLSASTEREDRRLKLPLYCEHGVRHVWLVDPRTRLVEVYEARAGAPTQLATARDGDVASLPPFDLALDLSAWWKPVR